MMSDFYEARVAPLKSENEKLKEQLNIAVKALEKYAKYSNWLDIELYDVYFFSAQFKKGLGYEIAQKALAKIKKA